MTEADQLARIRALSARVAAAEGPTGSLDLGVIGEPVHTVQLRARHPHALDALEAALLVMLDEAEPPLVLAPGEPQPDAPTDIAALPDYWDERRRRQGKRDLSRCAAELRIALGAKGG